MMDESIGGDPGGFVWQRFCRKCGALMIAYDSLQEDDFTLTWFRCPTGGCHRITVAVNTCFHLDGLSEAFSGGFGRHSPSLFPELLN